MSNKILKTLTLPNAQGELVKYELHPEWDNIEGKPDSFGVGEFYEVDGAVKGEVFNDYKNNIASGANSHAEGLRAHATGMVAHAEGAGTTASGRDSHAEGTSTTASGDNSHAEGNTTTASGVNSHSEGLDTQAGSPCSHAEGIGTIIPQDGRAGAHVQGSYNLTENMGGYLHVVGNGTSDTTRSNAHTLDNQGNAWYAGTMTTKAVIVGDMSYGETLPETGVEGQLFFLIGGSIGGINVTNDNGIITIR